MSRFGIPARKRSRPSAGRSALRRCCPGAPTTMRRSAFERENWFLRDWVCVGRDEDAPEPGTFFRSEELGEPLVVVRARDGVLRAFYNVCRHSGHRRRRRPSGKGGPLPMPVPRLDLRPRRHTHSGQAHGGPRGLQPRGLRPQPGPARGLAGRFVFVSRSIRPRRARGIHGRLVRAPRRVRAGVLAPAPGGPDDLRRGGELEDRGRELHRVLPLPGGPSAPQQADAVRPGRGLLPGRARGRAAGWSSPRAARRCRWTACATAGRCCTATSEIDERRIYYYILWPNLIVSVHPDYVLTHQAWPDGPNRTIVNCDLYVDVDSIGVAASTSPARATSGT